MKLLLVFAITNGLAVFAFGQSHFAIDAAKKRLAELHFNYAAIDEIYRRRVDAELSKAVDTQPKGEYETTKEFQARSAMAVQLRKVLDSKYQAEKQNRKQHFLKLIKEIEDTEFQKPARVFFGAYNADSESLPITVNVDGKNYDEVLKLPRAEAKILKENSTETHVQAIFGVGLVEGAIVDYYFASTISFRSGSYSTLPNVIPATQSELTQLYKDPFVRFLRKVLNNHSRGSAAGIAEAFFEGEALSGIDKDYFRSKFVVGLITPSAVGGKNIVIFFQDRPDVVFRAWVYKLTSTRNNPEYELRGFWLEESDPAKVRILRIVAKMYDPQGNAL